MLDSFAFIFKCHPLLSRGRSPRGPLCCWCGRLLLRRRRTAFRHRPQRRLDVWVRKPVEEGPAHSDTRARGHAVQRPRAGRRRASVHFARHQVRDSKQWPGRPRVHATAEVPPAQCPVPSRPVADRVWVVETGARGGPVQRSGRLTTGLPIAHEAAEAVDGEGAVGRRKGRDQDRHILAVREVQAPAGVAAAGRGGRPLDPWRRGGPGRAGAEGPGGGGGRGAGAAVVRGRGDLHGQSRPGRCSRFHHAQRRQARPVGGDAGGAGGLVGVG